jgi:hypothetical protein
MILPMVEKKQLERREEQLERREEQLLIKARRGQEDPRKAK